MRDNQKYLEWDVGTWARGLRYWEYVIEQKGIDLSLGLELGSRHGGLSLFFASQYQSQVYCSDVNYPSREAKELHHREGVSDLISYHDVNALDIPFSDDYFDFVFFKSVMGAVGRNNGFSNQERAFQEMHRVLKPGGYLFFAENLRGTWFHALGRRLLIPWGSSWRYMRVREIESALALFADKEIRTTGMLAAFVSGHSGKEWASRGDALLDRFIPASWQYVAYGWAKK